jgi:hypothetical protein
MRQKLACFTHFWYTWLRAKREQSLFQRRQSLDFTSEHAMSGEVASHG